MNFRQDGFLFRILMAGCLAIFLSTDVFATRWLLVDFGSSDATNSTPYSDWTNVLRHPDRTQYVDPDGDPSHDGVTETTGLPEDSFAFYGVQGTAPIPFRPGHNLIATFYNRSEDYAFLEARLSLTDADTPDPADAAHPWFTMQNRFYHADGDWVPPHSLVEMEYYVSDASRVSSLNLLPSEGDHRIVNISKLYNDNRFLLTRIELTDEADLTSPTMPGSLTIALTETTNGAGSNLVRLDWDVSTDPAPFATGVSRYLIYRNGGLYDLVSEDDVARLGSSLHYIDTAVKPNTPYTYAVAALDAAPFGLYPQGSRLNTRVGNESRAAGPVSITTGAWRSARLIAPGDGFAYLGAFRLPPDMDDDWSYASGGLAFYPEGNPGRNPSTEWTGSLYAYTHLQQRIAEIAIPIPSASRNVDDLPRAALLRSPVDLWPAVYGGATPSIPPGGSDIGVAALAYHPAANGVSARLYYGICNYYGSDGTAPSHGWFDLALTTSGGAWHLGGAPPANVYPGLTSRVAFAAPTAWADTHTGGRSLIVGSGFLSGGEVIAHGPSLYAIAPWETGALPAAGGTVSAVNLLRYSEAATLEGRVLNFTRDEFAEGGAWIEAGEQRAVAISFRRSVGDAWYGDALGNLHSTWDIPEPPMGDKGVCATRWKTGLMLYNPDDLAAVAAGTMESWEPQPYAVMDFSEFSLRADGGDGNAGAVAYDAANRRLFYIEHNGDPGYPDGYALIHVWQVNYTSPAIGTGPSGWLLR